MQNIRVPEHKKKDIELLAPGGSFAAAINALEAGADGVYFGLAKFSARRAAVNFSRDDLRRLKSAAMAMGGRKLYAAVNTVVKDSELKELIRTLLFLEAMKVDGVIIQDWGVFEILRREFPGLPVHASTQMAVHNSSGVGLLKELGFERVILARELSWKQIEKIRREHPDIGLEVFIHGALCYSFSGICLASGMLLERSANRGECAQLCRNYYRLDGRDGYWFSCRDLALEEECLRLRELGVDALKIEGRMKPPEYVRAHAALYRALLDGEDPRGERVRNLKSDCAVAFSRERCQGYKKGAAATQDLLCNDYPGHIGLPLGKVKRVKDGTFELVPERTVTRKDGLMFFEDDDRARPFRFAVESMNTGTGAPLTVAHPGKPVWITGGAGAVPEAGQEIRHISSRLQDLKNVAPEQWPLFAGDLAAEFILQPDGQAEIRAEHRGAQIRAAAALSVSPARNKRDFREILSKTLVEADKSLLRVNFCGFRNLSGLADDAVFVPPSELKKLKNDFYAELALGLSTLPERVFRKLEEQPWPVADTGTGARRLPPDFCMPLRQKLGDKLPGCEHLVLPFVTGTADLEKRLGQTADLPAGVPVILPLVPVCPEEEEFAAALAAAAASTERPLLIGLNNPWHLKLARTMKKLPHVCFFADFLCYTANRYALRFLLREVPGLAMAYSWIEGGHDLLDSLRDAVPAACQCRILEIDPDFRPPLFMSLACFWKQNRLRDSCQACRGKPEPVRLSNGRQEFLVYNCGCITYLFGD